MQPADLNEGAGNPPDNNRPATGKGATMTTLDKMQSELSDMAAAVDARIKQDAATIATPLDGLKRRGVRTEKPLAFTWYATDGNYDGAPDSNSPIGRGPTELAAVMDLLEQQSN